MFDTNRRQSGRSMVIVYLARPNYNYQHTDHHHTVQYLRQLPDKKHHQRKLQRVNHHIYMHMCKWTIYLRYSSCRKRHHQRMLQLVTTTTCASI